MGKEADLTPRDRVWIKAIELSKKEDKFKINDIIENSKLKDKQRKTIQRTLKAMDYAGFIEHYRGSRYYSAGNRL